MIATSFLDPLIALALGLLVGLQKERAASRVAGLKTFGLASLLGAVTGLLTPTVGGWTLGAGLLALVAVMAIGNAIESREGTAAPGQTTEVALLSVYMIGALAVLGSTTLAVVLGGAVAVLLHLREELKGMVRRMTDRDVHAIMQFVLVSLVVLPILPNRTFGPFDVWNPRNIWLMVVLIVGLNLIGYGAFRWLSHRSGAVVAGVLGGVVSSTATTFAYARSTTDRSISPTTAAAVIWIASTLVFVRILIEVAAVAPRFLPVAAPPLLLVLGAMAAGAVLLARDGATTPDGPHEPGNPAQLRSAIGFGVLYGAILLAVAAAERHLGSTGLYATAVLSGLTDIDAITLSTSRLVAEGRLSEALGWRLILVASLSNLLFKVGIAWALGGRTLGKRVGSLGLAATATGVLVLAFWPT